MTDAINYAVLDAVEAYTNGAREPRIGEIYTTLTPDPTREIVFDNGASTYLRSQWPLVEKRFQSPPPSLFSAGGITFGTEITASGGHNISAPNADAASSYGISPTGKVMVISYTGNVLTSGDFGVTWNAEYPLPHPLGGTYASQVPSFQFRDTDSGGYSILRGPLWHKGAWYILTHPSNESNLVYIQKSVDGLNWTTAGTINNMSTRFSLWHTNYSANLAFYSTGNDLVIGYMGRDKRTSMISVEFFYRFIYSTNDGATWGTTSVDFDYQNAIIPPAGAPSHGYPFNTLGTVTFVGDSIYIPYICGRSSDNAAFNTTLNTITDSLYSVGFIVSKNRGASWSFVRLPLAPVPTTPNTYARYLCALTSSVVVGDKLIFGVKGRNPASQAACIIGAIRLSNDTTEVLYEGPGSNLTWSESSGTYMQENFPRLVKVGGRIQSWSGVWRGGIIPKNLSRDGMTGDFEDGVRLPVMGDSTSLKGYLSTTYGQFNTGIAGGFCYVSEKNRMHATTKQPIPTLVGTRVYGLLNMGGSKMCVWSYDTASLSQEMSIPNFVQTYTGLNYNNQFIAHGQPIVAVMRGR